MLRCIFLILLCLLLGMVTTIGIAWGCGYWSQFDTGRSVGGSRMQFYGVGKMRISDATGHTEFTGLPFPALSHRRNHPGGASTPSLENGWVLGTSRVELATFQPGVRMGVINELTLSLRPVWPGFGINTILFALPWLMGILLMHHFKQRRRKRIGCCPKCGYNLRNDLSSGCPECGWNRREEG